MQRVYLDNNSTTPLDPQVFEAMRPYFVRHFGNPSNMHALGRETREAVAQARVEVAHFLGALPQEMFFTGGGSEADNWAVKGVTAALAGKGRHIVGSAIEHGAVLGACRYLEQHGYELTLLPVDWTGLVDPDDVKRALRPDTVLVSVMLANNEVGTIQPLAEIAAVCREHGVCCHTDAVAAAGKMEVNVAKLGVDLLTISAHKLHGPKGTGCLYVRSGTPIHPLLHGGHQEQGMRAGTENVAGIVGLGKACALAGANWPSDMTRVRELRDYLQEQIFARIEEVRVNGHPVLRLANTLSVGVGFVEGESLLVSLDLEGIAAASGSACSTGEAEPSATLKAMNVPPQFLNSPVRLSLGRENTRDEIDYTVAMLEKVVKRLRDISPIWKDRGKRFFNPPPQSCTTGDGD
jgi:cysteine desulfurase